MDKNTVIVIVVPPGADPEDVMDTEDTIKDGSGVEEEISIIFGEAAK